MPESTILSESMRENYKNTTTESKATKKRIPVPLVELLWKTETENT